MKAPELLPPSDTMYRALVNRDSSFEGIFFVGVRTTGIFCRPTCTAKKPARENVDFFATPSEALHGGYRPCLRCNPMDPDKRPPKLIERLRAEVERAPGGRLTDKELAAMSIDPSTARRQFKRHYGMTFQAYHRARRMGLALREVRRGGRVDEAKNGSGFESASGFREAFTRIFGDPPTTAKARPCMFAERIDTPLGAMLAVADDEGIAPARVRRSAGDGTRVVDPAETIADECSAGRTSTSRQGPVAAVELFFRKGSFVRFATGAGRIGFSTTRMEDFAFHSDRRDAFLFVDGGALGRLECATRRWSRERYEHDLHRHSVSSRHPRRRDTLRLRRRLVAQEMAARSRETPRSKITRLLPFSA